MKMIKNKFLGVLMSLAVSAPLLVACGGKSESISNDKVWTIGVDSDQGQLENYSDVILVSALKKLNLVVYDNLDNIVDDNFSNGGKHLTGGIDEGWSGITPVDAKWGNLTGVEYNSAYAAADDALANGILDKAATVNDGGATLNKLLDDLGVDSGKASALSAALVSAPVKSKSTIKPLVAGTSTATNNNLGITEDNIKIALVSDNPAGANDQSFISATYDGVKKWGADHGKTEGTDYKVIIPNGGDTATTFTPAEVESGIDTAVSQGFNVIIGPGWDYQAAFENKTVEYPDVAFIGIDFVQTNIDTATNAVNITFKENESGFLAGYAAAKAGFTKFGVVDGNSSEAEQKYLAGYALGIYSYDPDLDFTADHVYHSHSYTGSDEAKTTVSGWYEDGVQVVFTCAGGTNISVFDSAIAYNE